MIDRRIARGELVPTVRPFSRSLAIVLTCAMLWLLPIAAAAALAGTGSVFVQQGTFFSETAVVSFGGAYAVLAYIAQRAVESDGWLTPGEMLDGLALAETTPGPLIMVVQYVAFVAAFRHPSPLPPYAAAVAGSLLTTWVTFVPCFLWVPVGAPYVEQLRNNRALHAALSSVTAAIVGVVLNLSVWFALHTICGRLHASALGPVRVEIPEWTTLNGAALAIAAAALIAMLRFRLALGWTLLGAAVVGLLWASLPAI